MDDSHPVIGILGSLMFIAVGVVMVVAPDRIQRIAERSRRTTLTRYLPFASFSSSTMYVPALRVGGAMCILAGLFVLVFSLLTLLQS